MRISKQARANRSDADGPPSETTTRRSRLLRPVPVGIFVAGLLGAVLFERAELLVPVLALPPVLLATRTRDAVTLLTLYVALLFALPSRLVVGPLGASGTPANLIGIVALGWWAVARMVPGLGVARGFQPVRIVLLLFGMAFTVSYAMAYLYLPAPIEISAANRAVATVAAMGGVALLAADGIASRERLDILLRRLVAAATLMAAIGILQFFTGRDIAALFQVPGLTPNYSFGDVSSRSIFNRVQATAIHPIEFGVVLALVFPIALHFAMSARRGRRGWPILCTVVIAFALPSSVSRSAIVALAAIVIMLFLNWNWKQRRQALTIGVLFIGMVRVLVPGLVGTIRSLFTNLFNDPSTTGRTDDYAIVGDYISRAPYFGRGMFTFIPDRYTTLDNQMLLTVIEMGFVGLAALLLLYLVGVFLGRGARRRSVDPETRQLGQALSASMVALLVTALTFDQLSFPMATGVLFLLLGCSGALWRLTGGPGARPGELVPAVSRASDATRSART